MANDDPIRASDADREAVVATLREAYTAGRLLLDEFDERMAAAYASKTWGDLRELTVDLPTQPVLGTDVPDRKPPVPAVLPSFPPGQVPDTTEEADPPALGRHRSPLGFLIPVALWVLLVAHGAVAPGLIFVFIVVCTLVSIMASSRRR
jgi:Domain of unknown function (DUF1707)